MSIEHVKSLEDFGSHAALSAQLPRSSSRELLNHPYVILRIAGLPFSIAQALSTGSARRLLDLLQAAKSNAALLTQKACDVLEFAVSLKSINQDQRHVLLKARRCLFNGRLSGLAEQDNLLDHIGGSATSVIRSADVALGEVLALESEFTAGFAVGGEESSKNLRAMCMESGEFLKGVAFSSPSLIADLIGSFRDPDKYVGKRARTLDSALFNYLIRAATKVSPLSYFTPVHVVAWSHEPDATFTLNGRKVVSDVEFSRRALSHIMAALSRNLKFWGDAHPLVLNPTTEMDGEALRFRQVWGEGPNNGRTWGVHQPLVRFPVNERIQGLLDVYKRAGDGSAISVRDLYAALDEQGFAGLSPREFVTFVKQAVHAGLLLPVLDLYDQEDWMTYVSERLGERMTDAAGSLKTLNETLVGYSHASYESRVGLSAKVSEAYRDLCIKVGTTPLADDKTPLFYEDCHLDGDASAVSVDCLGDALTDMQRVSELLPVLDFNHIIQSVTAALLRQRGGGRHLVPASEVAQAIAADAHAMALRLTPLPLWKQEEELSAISPNAGMLMRGKMRFFETLWERMAKGDPVILDDEFIDSITDRIPLEVRRRPSSYTVIGQANGRVPGEHFILNRLYSGHSMLMSRFLRGQDEAGIRRVSRYLRRVTNGARMVEIPGVFGFNANLHPRFTDSELEIPGRLPNYCSTSKVPLGQLLMRYDEKLDRIVFVSPSGEDLSIHYFGFLNLMALPNIYQLLGRANLQGLILDLWQDLYFAGRIPQDRISLLPRVTFNNAVLSRRSLFIPVDQVPSADLKDVDFFRALHSFLYQLNERGDHYVRLIATRDDFFSDDGDGRGNIAVTTDFKPAYVSLDLPLTVSNLKRRLARRRRSILIQEALPGPGCGGVEWNGAMHACEYQFEVSRTGEI